MQQNIEDEYLKIILKRITFYSEISSVEIELGWEEMWAVLRGVWADWADNCWVSVARPHNSPVHASPASPPCRHIRQYKVTQESWTDLVWRKCQNPVTANIGHRHRHRHRKNGWPDK